MNLQNIAVTAAAIAALAPAICNATPENDAVNACARAFATTLAPPGADGCSTDARGAVVAFAPIPMGT